MTSEVDAIATNRGLWDTTKKVANTYMNFSFGCGQDSRFIDSILARGEYKGKPKLSIQDAYTRSGLGKSWWGPFKEEFTRSKISDDWADCAKGAGKTKQTLRFLGKKMPFIGNAIFLLTEAPNIFRAFTDTEHGGGIGTGIKETVKFGAKAAAFAVGAVIGNMAIPFVGGLIGGMVAGWLADKVLGKSFTDKKEEAEAEKAKLAQQVQQPQQQTSQSVGAGGIPQQFGNPYGQSGMNSNSVFQADWKDKDLMAMSVGLA